MLTMIFILSLMLACLSLLLMGLTLKVKLPLFTYKATCKPETGDDLYYPRIVRRSKAVDIGILDSRVNRLSVKEQVGQYLAPNLKLLEYGSRASAASDNY